MPRLKLEAIGTGGLLTDLPPTQLPPSAINLLTNGLCQDGSVRFVGGEIKLVDISIKPLYHYLYVSPGTDNNLFIVSDGVKVHAYNSDGLVKQLKSGLNGGAVTFTTLNGILVFNSETNGPFFVNIQSDGSLGDTDQLPDWKTNWRCKQIIAYKYYLIALGFKEGIQELPYLIRWSNSADPGAIPSSWTPLASNDAGDVIIADTQGIIITSVLIRDALWIIKEDSIYSLQWVGGQFIFQTTKLTDMIGSRISSSVCEFQSGLALLTSDDVFYFNGQTLTSLVRGLVRDKIFSGIGDNWRNTQLMASSRRGMLLLGAPSRNSEKLLNNIYIFNINDGGWSHKDFYYGYGFNEGFVKKELIVPPAWDDITETWNQIVGELGIWDPGVYDPAEKQIILYKTNANDTEWWIEVWSRAFDTNQADQAIKAVVGRSGLSLIQHDQIVMVKDIWVEVAGNVEEVEFTVGIQKAQRSQIIKQGPWKVIPNETNKFSPRITGRFFHWQMNVNSIGNWRLISLIIDFEPAGER